MVLIARLASRNLRARPGQALLLLLALCVATTSVTLALAVNETGNDAWDRLHRTTNGFHIRAGMAYIPPVAGSTIAQAPKPGSEDIARTHEQLAALATDPAVIAASGPWPTLWATGEVGGTELELFVNVRDAAPAGVGQPFVTSGRWLDGSDGVVLEDGLALSLRVGPGDAVTIAGRRLVVLGTAMTVSIGRYPLHQPGRVWVSASTADALRAAGATDAIAETELRLARPEDAPAVVAAYTARNPELARAMYAETRQETRAGAHDELTVVALALLVISTLLASPSRPPPSWSRGGWRPRVVRSARSRRSGSPRVRSPASSWWSISSWARRPRPSASRPARCSRPCLPAPPPAYTERRPPLRSRGHGWPPRSQSRSRS
jgi:putative ABC transport system permease protein